MPGNQRGQEVQVKLSIEGQPADGSWHQFLDWELTPIEDITEDEFLGEDTTDFDLQHHGWRGKFSILNKDAVALQFMHECQERQRERLTPHRVIMTVLHNYRLPDSEDQIQTLTDMVLKADTHGSARKDRTKTSFSFACKKSKLTAA